MEDFCLSKATACICWGAVGSQGDPAAVRRLQKVGNWLIGRLPPAHTLHLPLPSHRSNTLLILYLMIIATARPATKVTRCGQICARRSVASSSSAHSPLFASSSSVRDPVHRKDELFRMIMLAKPVCLIVWRPTSRSRNFNLARRLMQLYSLREAARGL